MSEKTDRERELEDVLTSVRVIASRKGDDVAWDLLDQRIEKLNIGRVTAKVFRRPPLEEDEGDRLLRFFAWSRLPEPLQEVSRPFGSLAVRLCTEIPRGPERSVALRKLLEAKDAAVRAALHPGV